MMSIGSLRRYAALAPGAMVAATDPAAVVSTFQRLPTPRRLDTLVQGESLLKTGFRLRRIGYCSVE